MRILIPLLLIILSVFVFMGCTTTDTSGTGESAQTENSWERINLLKYHSYITRNIEWIGWPKRRACVIQYLKTS